MTTFSNAASVNDAVVISGLSSLAIGAYSAPSTLFDNTPASSRAIAFLRGSLRLAFSSPLTAGTGSPYITLYRLAALDGTALPSPPGTAAAAPSVNAPQSVRNLNASGTYQYIDFGPFDLDPFLYGFQVFNNSGVAFSGTVTATLYRWNIVGA